MLRAQGGMCPDLAIVLHPTTGWWVGLSDVTLWPAEWRVFARGGIQPPAPDSFVLVPGLRYRVR